MKPIYLLFSALIVCCAMNVFADQNRKKVLIIRPASPSITSKPTPDAKSVYAKAAASVVKIEAITYKGRMQGSGVSFANGGERIDETKDLDGANIKLNNSWIATNAHVVNGASEIILKQGVRSYKATIEFLDVESDIALLMTDEAVIPKIDFANSSSKQIGEKVYAIGSPLGLENSISEGIVSGAREMNGIFLIQTTAPISPGNSGGGLFDSEGELLGITTFKLKGGENLNFAIDSSFFNAIKEAHTLESLVEINSFIPSNSFEKYSWIKWLATTKDENGLSWWKSYDGRSANKNVKTKTEIIKYMEDEKSWFKHLAESYSQYLNTRPAQSAEGGTDSTGKTTTLVCLYKKQEVTYKIDFIQSTVNGDVAKISDIEIQFQYKNSKGRETKVTINRYTGSALIAANDMYVSGKCQQVANKQF